MQLPFKLAGNGHQLPVLRAHYRPRRVHVLTQLDDESSVLTGCSHLPWTNTYLMYKRSEKNFFYAAFKAFSRRGWLNKETGINNRGNDTGLWPNHYVNGAIFSCCHASRKRAVGDNYKKFMKFSTMPFNHSCFVLSRCVMGKYFSEV